MQVSASCSFFNQKNKIVRYFTKSGLTAKTCRFFELVGGIPTPLKNMSSSVGAIFPIYGKNNPNVQNHQPVNHDETVKNLQESMVSSPQNHWRKGPLISHKFLYDFPEFHICHIVVPCCPMIFHGFSLYLETYLMIFHGFPMDFPWFSHGFSMIFHDFP